VLRNRVAVRRGAAAVIGALAGVLFLVPPAAAHVTVDPAQAKRGSYTTLTLRVPNEKPGATTVKVEVVLPEDAPIPTVTVKPTTGWAAAPTTTKLRRPVETADGVATEGVTRIAWTVTTPAAAIQPGQFQEFDVSAGPLPDTDRLVLRTLQTYSDGTVARWIEEPPSDSPHAE
jgi:uncharacterized protein YcnI